MIIIHSFSYPYMIDTFSITINGKTKILSISRKNRRIISNQQIILNLFDMGYIKTIIIMRQS